MEKAGQGGRIGQGWMSGRGGGDRSEGVKDEAPKQVSEGQTQTDRQNTLSMAVGAMNTFIRHPQPRTKNTWGGWGCHLSD